MKRVESLRNSSGADFLYRLLYVGILSSIVLFCFSDLHGIFNVNWRHVAVLVAAALFFSTACMLDGRQRVYVAALCLFVFLFLFFSIGSERCLQYFGQVLGLNPLNRMSSLNHPSTINETILPEEIVSIELGRVFLLTAVCYPVQQLLGKNIFLKMISADIVGGWLLYMRKAPKMGVVFFVLYTGLTVAEWVRFRWKKMKKEKAQAYMIGVLPFLILYTVLLCFMPMQEKPYEWQWARNLYRRAENRISMYTENLWNIGNEYFSGSASGFSEEGGWFSDLVSNDEQLMTLGIVGQRDVSVYLSGKVFDSFTGRGWENRRESKDTDRSGRNDNRSSIGIRKSERALDVAETMYALKEYAETADASYYQNIRMNVSYLRFHTGYLMAPSKTWRIENENKNIDYYVDGGNIIFGRSAGYGTGYALQFYRFNMEREELYRFLEWDRGEDAETWSNITQQYTGSEISIGELDAYRETVKEQYLPTTVVSAKTKEWLAYFTAEADSDVEKLKCIENALADMQYNTSPGKLPNTVTDETSFLDYFLLEKREGYCIHFATAFVLLARAEGFPARYVQGFCVPSVSGDDTPVYANMAHAWPEVYIEGKGWIPFEPTPGFAINRYPVHEENADADIGNVNTGELESLIQDDVHASGYQESEEIDPEEDVLQEPRENRLLYYLIRVILILLFGSTLAFVIDWLGERHRDTRRSIGEKYKIAALYNFRILAMLGYRREISETYHELAERIRKGNAETDIDGDSIETNGKDEYEVPCDFIETYEEYLYGTPEINEQILTEVLTQRVQLLARLKKCKRRRYLLCRIRLYIMRYR